MSVGKHASCTSVRTLVGTLSFHLILVDPISNHVLLYMWKGIYNKLTQHTSQYKSNHILKEQSRILREYI